MIIEVGRSKYEITPEAIKGYKTKDDFINDKVKNLVSIGVSCENAMEKLSEFWDQQQPKKKKVKTGDDESNK